MRKLQRGEGRSRKRHLKPAKRRKRRKMLERTKRARTKRKERRVKKVRLRSPPSKSVEDRLDQEVGVDGREVEGVVEEERGGKQMLQYSLREQQRAGRPTY